MSSGGRQRRQAILPNAPSRRAPAGGVGDGEAGFTLVEVVVSLTVLAVGILSTVQVFMSSLGVVGQVSTRARAVAMATEELESMHAVPYDILGFATTQLNFVATFEDRSTVEVPNPLIEPRSTRAFGAIQATVDRHVTWDDASSPDGTVSYAGAYKRGTVVVSWTDGRSARSVRVDGLMYPGGRGAYVGTTTTTAPSSSTLPPAAPFDLAATLRAGAEHSTVDLSWSAGPSDPPVASWVVQYSSDGFATANELTSTQPATITTFSVDGLSPSTAYTFRVAGVSAAGVRSAWSNVAGATTADTSTAACQVGTATITPNAVSRRDNGTTVLASDAGVTVNTSGPCTGLRLSYRPTAANPTSVVLAKQDTSVWSGTVDGRNTSWDTGTHQISVLDGDGATVATLAFTVCANSQKSCP